MCSAIALYHPSGLTLINCSAGFSVWPKKQ
jgi:hypothetical protein